MKIESMRFYCIFLDSTSQSVKDSEELDEQHFEVNLLQTKTGLAAPSPGGGGNVPGEASPGHLPWFPSVALNPEGGFPSVGD
ncbi:hypothetical protein [Phormidesmis priestleyi]